MNVRNYQLIQELGRGTFGVTYLGNDLTHNRHVAVKTIDIAKSEASGADLSVINDEIETLKILSQGGCSKYIACYYESFQDDFEGVPTIFIISEYIDGGSLTDFINMYPGNVPVTYLWPLFSQLLQGLNFIHTNGYAHRDIKPDNIMITKDFSIKYIDFGIACLEECRTSSCSNTCKPGPGTLYYLPPEFFTQSSASTLAGAQAHDMWSLAMVMSELANGLYAYPFVSLDYSNKPLPQNDIAGNIARAPSKSSNYSGDDGRTNRYLSQLIINDWRARPTVLMALSIFLDIVISPVWSF